MALIRLCVVVFLASLTGPASADCVAGAIEGTSLQLEAEPPAPLDLSLRPVVPDCLRDLSGPEKENCPRAEIIRYGEEVEIWVEALNDYATATNRFANNVAAFSNSTVQYARRAREFADLAFEFRNCEAALIYSGTEE